MDTRQAFELEMPVRKEEIDRMGHVNNVVYLRWVQEAAVRHWYAVASEEEKASLLWVVKRHEIDYRRPAFVGDAVIVRTWVGEASGRSFERLTEMTRKSDGKLLAKARTLWSPVDFATKTPVEVGPEIYARYSTNH